MLVVLLVMALAAPAAFASDKVALFVNGDKISGDLSIEDGVSFIDAQALNAVPQLDLTNQQGAIPIRQFFESRGGTVKWDGANKKVLVAWQYADELVVRSTEILKNYNTYKMKGTSKMEMSIAGAEDTPQIPTMQVILEGVVQQEPLAIHIKQVIQMPWEEMGLSPEEVKELGSEAEMVTEIVLKADAMYQRMPMSEQWIVTDFAGMGMTESFTQMMQTTPQQSLEMMRKHGIINKLSGEVEIDGQKYYVIKNQMDSDSFSSLLQEMLGEFNFGIAMTEAEQMQMQAMLESMEVNFTIESFINANSLLTERMVLDMIFQFTMDEVVSPEGPVTFTMRMIGEYLMFDFGLEITIPDVSNAITQPIPEEAAGGQSK